MHRVTLIEGATTGTAPDGSFSAGTATGAAGPMADMNGETWSGDGMVVIRAESLEDAKAIAAADPMHATGARKYMVRPWIVNEGTMTVKVGFASGSRELI